MVVVTHRPTDWLGRCIESVVAQADEVVVVDNGSSGPRAAEISRKLGAVAIRLDHNRGFAGGANAGLKRASGDVVALLNDDAVAPTGWLDAAARVLGDPGVAAVAPKLLLARRYAEVVLDGEVLTAPGDHRSLGRRLASATCDGRDVLGELTGPGIHELEHDPGTGPAVRWRWTAGRGVVYVPLAAENDDPTASPEIFLGEEHVEVRRIVDLVNTAGSYLRSDGYCGDCGADEPDEPDDARIGSRRDCFAASAAALVTTREVLARVGSLVEGYFAYYEDTEWCWRSRLFGYRIVYDPASTIRHVRGMTSGGSSSTKVRFLAERNRLWTLGRCAPLPVAREQYRRKRVGRGDDGVARMLPLVAARALAERAVMRRHWTTSAEAVFAEWAGVDLS